MQVAATPSRFALPKTEMDVQEVKDFRIAKKTLHNNIWATNIWHIWAIQRFNHISEEEKMSGHNLDPNITKMTSPSINYWLQRFVLEARKVNGDKYCPDSLHQVFCGLQRALRACDRTDTNFFGAILTLPNFAMY